VESIWKKWLVILSMQKFIKMQLSWLALIVEGKNQIFWFAYFRKCIINVMKLYLTTVSCIFLGFVWKVCNFQNSISVCRIRFLVFKHWNDGSLNFCQSYYNFKMKQHFEEKQLRIFSVIISLLRMSFSVCLRLRIASRIFKTHFIILKNIS
jgi:hypothetical protein